jgi:hypothetical protein
MVSDAAGPKSLAGAETIKANIRGRLHIPAALGFPDDLGSNDRKVER